MVHIGIIGCGNIAQGAHIPPLLEMNDCKITAICDIKPEVLQKVGDKIGVDPSRRFIDYHDLLALEDIDAVEICTPNYLHVPIAVDAVKAGKAINVEKPLGLNYEQTQDLQHALAESPQPNMICFSYRFRAATRYAKKLLDEGAIGKVVFANVQYLKSTAFWEGRRLEWRFIKKYAGTGVLGDLGAHLIDMARLLLGDVTSVCAMTGIVVKERQNLDNDDWAPVETDDYCNFLAELGDHIPASFTITRCALGHINTIVFEIYGTEGVISFDLDDPHILHIAKGSFDRHKEGIPVVEVPKEYEVHQQRTFIDTVEGKTVDLLPTIADGIACQKILDALYTSSEEKRWVDITPDK